MAVKLLCRGLGEQLYICINTHNTCRVQERLPEFCTINCSAGCLGAHSAKTPKSEVFCINSQMAAQLPRPIPMNATTNTCKNSRWQLAHAGQKLQKMCSRKDDKGGNAGADSLWQVQS